MATGPAPQRRSSNTFARERDALLNRLLERHPATAGMLVGIRLFPTRKKASKRLARLCQRKQVRLLGTVALKAGRPEHVYGRGRWKGDNLLHEVQLTRVCLKIHADALRRGSGEVDAFLRPDAEIWIAGVRYYLEMDMGTMSVPDVVRKRFTKYRSNPDLVLWVCPSATRMETLRTRAGMIRATALFTTLDSALTDPHAHIWIDADGERAALPGGTRGGNIPTKGPGDKGGDKPWTLSPPACGGTTTSLPANILPASRQPPETVSSHAPEAGP